MDAQTAALEKEHEAVSTNLLVICYFPFVEFWSLMYLRNII